MSGKVQCSKVLPELSSTTSFVCELKTCTKADLNWGKLLHSAAIQAGFHNNVYVANSLISMYKRCGEIHQARCVFDHMTTRDVVSWNVIITAYVEDNESLTALDIFQRMDCRPNRCTFLTALKACTLLATADKEIGLLNGKMVENVVRQFGFYKDVSVASTMVKMFSRLGDMKHAWLVFKETRQRDAVAWNVIIIGYVENGQYATAMKVLTQIDVIPNRGTFVAGLKACAGLEDEKDKNVYLHELHSKATELGLDKDVLVGSSLMDMYSRSGDILQVRRVFERVTHRDVVLWNVLLCGYVENGESLLALDSFSSMDCEPNHLTFVAVFKACACLAAEETLDKTACLEKGMTFHEDARKKGLDSVMIVANTLLDMYSKCGDMTKAHQVFNGMKHRNVVTWSSLVTGYVENGQHTTALEVFDSMNTPPNAFTLAAALKACTDLAASKNFDRETCLRRGLKIYKLAEELCYNEDVVLATTMLDMYSKLGDMSQARAVFDGMKHRSFITWKTLILGYVLNGELRAAMEVFDCMDCPEAPVTFTAALKACGGLGAVEAGRRIHALVCKLGQEQEKTVETGLVDFYGKCGKMDAAEQVFNAMHSRNSTQTWTALIGGYSSLGNTSRVFTLVERMIECDVQMSGVTLQLILTACSHAGLVEEGQRWFESMPKYGVQPGVEHYTCMVDMLGRANKLNVALLLLKGISLRGDAVLWKALLAASTKCCNVEVGEVAFRYLVSQSEDEESAAAAYVLMSNLRKSSETRPRAGFFLQASEGLQSTHLEGRKEVN